MWFCKQWLTPICIIQVSAFCHMGYCLSKKKHLQKKNIKMSPILPKRNLLQTESEYSSIWENRKIPYISWFIGLSITTSCVWFFISVYFAIFFSFHSVCTIKLLSIFIVHMSIFLQQSWNYLNESKKQKKTS